MEKYPEAIIKILVRAKLFQRRLEKGRRRPADASPRARAAACCILPLWQGLDRAVSKYLDGMSLANLLKQGPS